MQHLKVLINKGQKEVKSYCFIKFHADTTDIGMEIKKKGLSHEVSWFLKTYYDGMALSGWGVWGTTKAESCSSVVMNNKTACWSLSRLSHLLLWLVEVLHNPIDGLSHSLLDLTRV